MKVLEVIHGLTPGGAESALVQRLRHQPDGTRTTVVSATPVSAVRRAELAALSVPVIEQAIGWRGGRDRVVPWGDADVVITHSPGETILLLTARPRLPTIVVAHHSYPSDSPRLHRLKRAALRVANPRADMHIAVSRTAAAGAQCAGGRRVVVHPLGAEITDLPPDRSAWPEGTRLRLMTLSRLVGFKNVPSLIEAVGRTADALRAAGAHIAVVGDGPLLGDVQRHVAELGVGDVVSMRPRIADPSGLLRAADAMISCAVSEGGPLTVFEAALAGTRVLATPTGVAPDVLDSDPGSVLTRDASPGALANGLQRLISLGPVGSDRAARADVAQQWRAAGRAPAFYDLIRSVLRSPYT